MEAQLVGQIDTVMVFTARSPGRIIEEGGSQAWKLNPPKAKACTWLVCTQNRHHPDHNFSDATEPQGAAFLVGKISGVADRTDDARDGRWKITISEYALINLPDTWDHDRNPVRYTSLEKLGIDPDTLDFQPMPSNGLNRPNFSTSDKNGSPMTIEDAKRMLAVTFGVKPEAIEITIRG
jgi:hypothetical protein